MFGFIQIYNIIERVITHFEKRKSILGDYEKFIIKIDILEELIWNK